MSKTDTHGAHNLVTRCFYLPLAAEMCYAFKGWYGIPQG